MECASSRTLKYAVTSIVQTNNVAVLRARGLDLWQKLAEFACQLLILKLAD